MATTKVLETENMGIYGKRGNESILNYRDCFQSIKNLKNKTD